MKKVLRSIIFVLLGLAILIGLFSHIGGVRLAERLEIEVSPIEISRDSASIVRGKHWVDALCTSCHGPDLTGSSMISQTLVATICASNITGLAEHYTEADFIRAIRHGVDQRGEMLAIMPADIFQNYSREDLADIVAYLQTLPRHGEDQPATRFGIIGKAMLAIGLLGQPFPAAYLDHNLPYPSMSPISDNRKYGSYLSGFCTPCHGKDLAGGYPTSDHTSPYAPALNPGGVLDNWTKEEYHRFFQTGTTPEGREVNEQYMPWREFGKLNPDELSALWQFLKDPLLHDSLEIQGVP